MLFEGTIDQLAARWQVNGSAVLEVLDQLGVTAGRTIHLTAQQYQTGKRLVGDNRAAWLKAQLAKAIEAESIDAEP